MLISITARLNHYKLGEPLCGITHLKLAFVIPIPLCQIQNLCRLHCYCSLKIKIDI